jgi:hypothetical protein
VNTRGQESTVRLAVLSPTLQAVEMRQWGGMCDVLAGCGSGLSLSAKYIPHVAWDDELTYSFSLCSQNLLSKIDLLNNAVSSLKNRSAAR